VDRIRVIFVFEAEDVDRDFRVDLRA